MSDQNSADSVDFRDSTLPGADTRDVVRCALDEMLDSLIGEVGETTEALRRHKSDYPPETLPSSRH